MTEDQTTGLLIGGVSIIFILIVLVYYVFYVIACWKIFTKAGEKGWKSLIPVYNMFVQFKLTWTPIMVLVILVLMGVYGAMPYLPQTYMVNMVCGMAGMVGIILMILGCDKLSKSFGKGRGFTLGLFALTPIFYMILGFGKAQYIGNTTQQ